MWKIMILSTAVIIILVQATTAEVSLIDNGYSTVVVAVHDNVPEDSSLLDAVKREFTAASSYLYTATKNRAYFKDITILVPQTWPDRDAYGDAVTETFDTAQIQIEPGSRDTAYVLRSPTCGTTDGRMHVTPNRIKGEATRFQFSPPSRMLVHEWGHLRWGVFDEYATRNKPRAYVTTNGELAGTTCSVQLATTGSVVDSNGSPCSPSNVHSCRFILPATTNSKASIMSSQFLPSVDSFCTISGEDGVRHNVEAPNKQNIRCKYRSTWDVIMSHADFSNGANPPGNVNMDTIPTVKIVRQTANGSYVLVLDISGSMRGDKIVQLRQAARKFIESASDNAKIGIVVFNSVASIRVNLLTIRTAADRLTLINSIPGTNEPDGGTAIGAGLQTGVAVLAGRTAVGDVTDVGGSITLVTDGEETDAPLIESVIPLLVSAKVKVYPIGIGSAASSKLSGLATATGGTPFFVNAGEAGLSGTALLYEALLTIVDKGRASGTAAVIQILSTSVDVAPFAQTSGSFTIDPGVGLNTTISFAWIRIGGSVPNVTITSPSGIVTANANALLIVAFNTLEFQLNGIAEVGEWTYTIGNTASLQQTVTIGVTTRPSSRNPVILTSKLSDLNVQFPALTVISAELRVGDKFVVGANVTALVSRPNSFPVTVILYDNGVDPDSDPDDGLYAAFFTQYVRDGRYNVIVKATAGTNEAMAVDYNPISDIVPDDQSTSNSDTNNQASDSQPLGAFVRSTSAGVLTLSNYTSRDLMPPARITDLTATGSNYNPNRSVTLQWTATGDDAYTGNAAYCNLSLATSFYDLINTTAFNMQGDIARSDVLSGSLDPLPGGSVQNVTVRIADGVADKQYYAALTCTDDANNPSEVSNIERFTLTPPTPTPTHSGSENNTGERRWMTMMMVAVVVATFM